MMNDFVILEQICAVVLVFSFLTWWYIVTIRTIKKHQKEWNAIKSGLKENTPPGKEYEAIAKAYEQYCEKCFKSPKWLIGSCYPRI